MEILMKGVKHGYWNEAVYHKLSEFIAEYIFNKANMEHARPLNDVEKELLNEKEFFYSYVGYLYQRMLERHASNEESDDE